MHWILGLLRMKMIPPNSLSSIGNRTRYMDISTIVRSENEDVLYPTLRSSSVGDKATHVDIRLTEMSDGEHDPYYVLSLGFLGD